MFKVQTQMDHNDHKHQESPLYESTDSDKANNGNKVLFQSYSA